MFNFTYAFPWQHVIKGKWEFNHLTNTNLILRKLSRGCSPPMHSKTFYICFKSGKKSLRVWKTVTLYPALTCPPPPPPSLRAGGNVILFLPNMNGLQLIKWRIKNNNYLLNGNKVQLYFIEMNSRFFISRVTKESERNNISRVHRGEIKALYYRLIRKFIFWPRIINPFEPLRNCETQTKTRMNVIKTQIPLTQVTIINVIKQ